MSQSTSIPSVTVSSAVISESTPALSGQTSTPRQLVDAMHGAFGRHAARAVHAKGIILEGVFEPDARAASLTRAAHLQQTPSHVVLRFSDFTGIPDIADGNGLANPRGLALKLELPDGTTTDIVSHSFNGFPTPTSDQFRELLLAVAASGPNAPKPTALDQFLEAHPIAKTFLSTQKTPASYATIAYFGVNAFEMSDAAGTSRFIRYQFLPRAGEQLLSAQTAAAQSPNYLFDEIEARVQAGPIAFELFAQLAEPGDRIDDPSVAWPDSRERVRLGVITLTRLAANTPAEDRALAFNPRNLPDGIRTADPMLDFRARAYPLSVRERQMLDESELTTRLDIASA